MCLSRFQQIAKNTSNLYEMWNDVKDLLNKRLDKLSTGCKIHAIVENIKDTSCDVDNCHNSLLKVDFSCLKDLEEEKKGFTQVKVLMFVNLKKDSGFFLIPLLDFTAKRGLERWNEE